MRDSFKAQCLATLIGSIPLQDHDRATKLVLEYTPQIPLWVQLPMFRKEGMVAQFLPGMPGRSESDGDEYIDTNAQDFDQQLLEFYEEYMAVSEGNLALGQSRFVLDEDRAAGFFNLLEAIQEQGEPPVALKGQISGPITFSTGLKDQEKRAIFYNEQLRDSAVKLLALKARWQVESLARFNVPVIVFLDEPSLAGFGSSEFISITKDDVQTCLTEIIDQIHGAGALVGVHVCANADWSLILESGADILSFDAYSYFDKLLLYAQELKTFLDQGKIIAWGIVPTLDKDDIAREETDSLQRQLQQKISQMAALGIDEEQIFSQSLITPSCGTGSLNIDEAIKVMRLTREVSEKMRGNA